MPDISELKLGHDQESMTANLKLLLEAGYTFSQAIAMALQIAGKTRSEFDDYLTEDMDNRMLFAVGEFNGINVTLQDLQNIVDCYKEGVLIPVVKITHAESEDYYNNPVLCEFPFKFGEVHNLRIENNQLFGDMKNVPKKICRLVKNGYLPNLSVEIYRNMPAPNLEAGKVYPCALDAVALLGSQRPALWEVMESYGLKDSYEKITLSSKKESFSNDHENGQKQLFQVTKEVNSVATQNNKPVAPTEEEKKGFMAFIKKAFSLSDEEVKTVTTTEVKPTAPPATAPATTQSFAQTIQPGLTVDEIVQQVKSQFEAKYNQDLEKIKSEFSQSAEEYKKILEKSKQEKDQMRLEAFNKAHKLPHGLNNGFLEVFSQLDTLEASKPSSLKFSLNNEEVPSLKEAIFKLIDQLPKQESFDTELIAPNGQTLKVEDLQKYGNAKDIEGISNLEHFNSWAKEKNVDISSSAKKRQAFTLFFNETGIVV